MRRACFATGLEAARSWQKARKTCAAAEKGSIVRKRLNDASEKKRRWVADLQNNTDRELRDHHSTILDTRKKTQDPGPSPTMNWTRIRQMLQDTAAMERAHQKDDSCEKKKCSLRYAELWSWSKRDNFQISTSWVARVLTLVFKRNFRNVSFICYAAVPFIVEL